MPVDPPRRSPSPPDDRGIAREALDGLPIALLEVGPDGARWANRACLALLRLTPEEARGHGWTARIHPDDLETADRVAVSDGDDGVARLRLREGDGGLLPLALTRLPTATGTATRLLLVEWDEPTDGGGWQRLIHPDDRARVEAVVGGARTRGVPFEALHFRIVGPAGDARPVVASINFPDDRETGLPGQLDDAGAAGAAEAQAQEIEVWRSAVDALAIGAFVSRRGHGPEYVNAAARAIFGADEERLLGSGWRSFIHPDDHDAVVGAIRGSYEEGAPFPSLAFRIVRPDGATRTVALSVVGDRQRLVSVGIVADITDTEAERAAREQESTRWRWMLDALPIGVFQATATGPDYRSRGFLDLFELDQDADGDAWVARIHESDRVHVLETVARYRDDPAARAPFDFRIVRRDGGVRHLTTVYAVEPPGSGSLTGLVLDVTAAVEAEAERFEVAEKMAEMTRLDALGVLAGGIAHDFNNLLMVILGYIDLAGQELPGDTPAAKMLGQVHEAATRAAMLARAMLSYAGRRVEETGSVDLSRLLHETAALAAARDSSAVAIDTGAVRDGLVVPGDETELGQVFLNLLVNATQAGRGGELVRIDVAARPVDRDDEADGLPPGAYAEVTVTDDGVGIDEPTRSRIFEPFFTTKDDGTGLGLSIVRGVVTAHGGTIDVHSERGRGTTFRVLLPAGATVRREPARQDALPTGRTGLRALVVDDQEPVLRLTQRVLAQAGVESVGVLTPSGAISTLEADPEGFDLVLTDLAMPGIPGDELWRALDAIRPGIPTIVVSGYAAEDVVERIGSSGTAAFLHKPWSIAELNAAIARVIGPA